MVSVKSYVPSYRTQMKKYGNYDAFRHEIVAYAGKKGTTPIRVNISNENPAFIKSLFEVKSDRAFELLNVRTKKSKSLIYGTTKTVMLDTLSDYFNLTNAQRMRTFDVIDQLTQAQLDEWSNDPGNKYLISEFFEYYESRKEKGLGGSEEVKDFFYNNIVNDIIEKYNIKKITTYNDI